MENARFSTPVAHAPGMGRKRYILAATLAVAALGVFLRVTLRPAEAPSEAMFRGKPLSAWLKQLGRLDVEKQQFVWDDVSLSKTSVKVNLERVSVDAEAADAIRQIGSNSFPYLLHAITNKESEWAGLLDGFLPGRPRKTPHAENPADQRGEAVLAFAALGTQAESLAPELTEALRQENNCKAAALALLAIGPKGWSGLTQTISNTNEVCASCAIWALGGQRVAVPGTLDALETAFTNHTTDPGVARRAGWALGRIGQDKEHVIPLLMAAINPSGNPLVNQGAVLGLGEFGTNASSAVPLLLQAKQSPQPGVGAEVDIALRKIDPTAGSKTRSN